MNRFFVFIDSANAPGRSRTRVLPACLASLKADAGFHAFVAAYACAGLFVADAAGVPQKFAPFDYGLMYANYSLLLAGCALVLALGVAALSSRAPFATLRRIAGHVSPGSLAAGAMLVVSISLHMGVFTSLKTMLPDISPFYADPALANIDEALHGGAPWRYTTALLPPQLTAVICPLYYGLWGLLVPTALFACIFVPKLRPIRSQYLWTYLLAWPILGNVVAGAAMSAGPIYYGLVTGDTQRFADLLAYLSHFPPLGNGARYLWDAYASGKPAVATGISAFPSMHVANATMFVLLAARIGRRWTWAAITFAAFVLFSSVHLAWHYAVDGYFSIAAMLLLWWAVGRVLRVFDARGKQ